MSKTKELIFDFRRSQCPVQPVTIGTDTVEIVNEYKYLGTIIDNQFGPQIVDSCTANANKDCTSSGN